LIILHNYQKRRGILGGSNADQSHVGGRIAIGTIWCAAGLAVRSAEAQQAQAGAASNDLQRAVEVFGYNVAAKSGATRGEVIYYYKCWNCHNDYTRAAGSPAPTLKGIFTRATLVTGDPVNDENVAKQIRNGSAQMPSFGTALKDADIVDLLTYLHNGCCYEETKPPINPWYRANAQNSPMMPERGNLRGGPNGVVRSAEGELLEGIPVQLIAPNAVRTTVYSDQAGRYEFPQLYAGAYTLRIAKPGQFLPYERDDIKIENAGKLEDIVLQRRSQTDLLPPTIDVLSQLTGAEWLWNLPGTAEEKQTFSRTCGEDAGQAW
jgi:mono/diheme cytochrome c family protein